ncbi:HugZ family protein [Clostridium massiliamazoniense]|uniref:HugZ family pyridoxamine 5'-phosphate oxidase n=1 Tax=Clostridium massiliamazoniense TaxID=1347366 RepID=UPI0006D762B1|nr:pyridoxamine 5'-phosphate oxidase family protein [Clostridium massiliamazoniense]
MEKLLNKQRTLMISSLDKDNKARISYSPFVNIEDKFYIYISKIAEHYNNIVNNPEVSIMIIEDEQDVDITFARERVSFNGTAKILKDNEAIIEKLSERQGKSIMDVLVGLDFDVFEIEVKEGRLVKGFGKAFDVKFEDGRFVTKAVIIDKHGK